MLLNLGGGMVMDLGTVVAALFQRGLRFVQVPTNLMAAADAAIGGHGNLDAGSVKNVLGVLHHPAAVVVDTAILSKLPEGQIRSGLVEIVKLAAMRDAEFFGWLQENLAAVLDRAPAALRTCVKNAVRLKADIVATGESNDARLFTQFGHTVGHALEALTRGALSHAEAVSIGMVAEMTAAGTPDAARIMALLDELQMPRSIPLEIHNQQLWDVMQRDRKAQDGQVRVAVPKRIGEGELRTITFEDFARARQ